ncbi:MAG: AbrB/MazE/SpoVT family DNA-binding domain-containing protein [Kiritimatiellia bacterium]
MVTATITSKGQITIPKTVRDSLRLQAGDIVSFTIQGENEAVLTPVTKTVDQVFGRLHKPGQAPKTVAEMNQAVAKRMRGGKA